MSANTKTYLGDAVYAEIEGGMVKLTTEDGVEATNTIWLEPEVYERLLKYVERINQQHVEKSQS